MATTVDFSVKFNREIKHLSRKFPKMIDEVDSLLDQLEADERPGDKIPQNATLPRRKNSTAGILYYSVEGVVSLWYTTYDYVMMCID